MSSFAIVARGPLEPNIRPYSVSIMGLCGIEKGYRSSHARLYELEVRIVFERLMRWPKFAAALHAGYDEVNGAGIDTW